MEILLTAIIISPLIAAIAGYAFRSKSAWPHLAGSGISLLGAVYITLEVGKEEIVLNYAGLNGEAFKLLASFESSLLSLVVAFVAFAIFIYAKGYMHEENGKKWFWPAISLFVAAMQLLVLTADWFMFITAWEVMAFASFLLIGTWHEEKNARTGAVKAFLQTRVADIGLYIGIFLVISQHGSLEIPFEGEEKLSLFASLCLLLAVMGKSAQVPLQSWLSAAMAGPTPVSALLHSATMVGAGALLLIRIFPLLPETALSYVAILGSATILLTGLTAIFSSDIKKMLAASTSSQFGFMLLAVGLGFPGAALGHWLAHAFMKSSLFLGAGVFQHAYEGTNYKKLKGGGKRFTYVFITFAIAGISLAGIPPMIGYFSKDGILASSFKSSEIAYIIIALTGAFFTGIYIAKALNRLWNGHAEEKTVPKKLWLLVGVTALVAVVLGGGFILEKLVKTAGYEFPKDKISKILGLTVAVLGLVSGWFFRNSWFPKSASAWIQKNYKVAGGYRQLIAMPVLKIAGWAYSFDRILLGFVQGIGNTGIKFSGINSSFDHHLLEGVKNIGKGIKQAGGAGRKWQSGLVHKELAITIGVMLVLLLILTASIFTI
ncbi:NADH-quinone oxidoreductase subunit L [Zunongwangia sp. H14]|uniref:NADH-quinone oxidoreductase subunit 5 family protein n=1 Tax=Zunongwangia sp. H14 TaxID=3240792 RepID=UPI00356832D1